MALYKPIHGVAPSGKVSLITSSPYTKRQHLSLWLRPQGRAKFPTLGPDHATPSSHLHERTRGGRYPAGSTHRDGVSRLRNGWRAARLRGQARRQAVAPQLRPNRARIKKGWRGTGLARSYPAFLTGVPTANLRARRYAVGDTRGVMFHADRHLGDGHLPRGI